MSWQQAIFSLLLFLCTAFALFLALLTWQRRSERGAWAFIIVMSALALWAAAYGMEQVATELESKKFWHRVSYVAIPIVPGAWLTFAMLTSQISPRWIRAIVPWLFIEPICVIILTWTDQYHALLWKDLFIDDSNGFNILGIERGIAFSIHVAYSYPVLLISFFLYLRSLFRSPSLQLRQVIMLSLGILLPFMINVVYISQGQIANPFDLTPLSLSTAGAIAGWFVFRFRISELLPVVWQNVFENMRDGVVVLDLEGVIVDANPAAQRMLNTTERFFEGHTIESLLPGSANMIAQQILSDEENTPNLHPFALELPSKLNRFVELTVSDLHDRRNRLTGRLLVLRDVTRRRLAEEAVRESERQYRNLIDLSPDPIILTDLETRIIICNQRAAELFGLQDVDDVLGRKAHEFIAPHQRDEFNDEIEQAFSGSLSQDQIYTIERKDGTTVSIEMNTTVVHDPVGRLKGIIAIARDVSERQRTEEALRQAQRMEGIGLLAGGVAHDFNNMLMSIVAQNMLALTHISNQSPAHRHIQKSMQSAERAADLTRQLLAYAGKGKLQVGIFDVNQLILENDALLETALPKTATLTLELSADVLLIKADRGQIQQVIMNLVLNASEALQTQIGSVHIATRIRQLSDLDLSEFLWREELSLGKYISIQVSDTGMGMDAEIMERIFDPFFTTKPDGRGLGLSALLGIIRSHGGGLRVESKPGQGTTFEVIFPSLDATMELVDDTKSGDVKWDISGTVLIVDDEESVREALSDLLELAGLQVITASDGFQGIQSFATHQNVVDLIMLDLSMPTMDGIEVLSNLRTMSPDIKVVLMSGYSESEISDLVNENRNISFVQKPCDPDRLISAVTEMLEN